MTEKEQQDCKWMKAVEDAMEAFLASGSRPKLPKVFCDCPACAGDGAKAVQACTDALMAFPPTSSDTAMAIGVVLWARGVERMVLSDLSKENAEEARAYLDTKTQEIYNRVEADNAMRDVITEAKESQELGSIVPFPVRGDFGDN